VIRFEYSRQPKVLLVHYAETFEQVPLDLLNELLARFVAEHGTADMIVDVSAARPTVAARPVMRRGLSTSLMPDRRRVFIVGNDVQDGLIRMYGTYQESIGMPKPMICNSMLEALHLIGAADARFADWPG
jgi:hypothetical protein